MSHENNPQAFTPSSRRQRTLQMIEKNTVLKQAFHLEPRLSDLFAEVNSLLTVEDRDLAYLVFKEKCARLVGFGAAKPELRTARHYLALLDFLGILLSWVEEHPKPSPDLEDEDTFDEDIFDEDLFDEETFDESTFDKYDAINAAVKQSLDASREASLEAFRGLTQQHQ